MSRKTKTVNMRLAMRVEGNFWNAYVAAQDSMEGAELIGSIAFVCVQDEDRRAAFLRFMSECFEAIVYDITGVEPEFTEIRPAPEHERSGRA